MEKLGEKLNLDFFTFKYPGREPLLLEGFLFERPDIKDLYIYDICLSSGKLLYSCAGGIGISKERYIVDMHKALSVLTFSRALEEKYNAYFGEAPTRHKYLRLREGFNKKSPMSLTLQDSVDLYLLWAASGFTHRYRGRGYDSGYMPLTPPYEQIKNSSRVSRDKKLLFRKEDLYTMSESIISDNVVIYAHIPPSYGAYGSNFLWGKKTFDFMINSLEEFYNSGYKVCVSMLGSKYQKPYPNSSNLFPSFNRITIPGFKGTELTTEPSFSEIYFLNF